ncbi:uncharacterized protein EI97DRAFT_431616 [Westerdykella ornata]|uniref:F-box domain-containing protein n=1 Tax=Westerdykella ornata TaxID=318751 RepID=A0A6A6JTQ8_WESOR|nr:uncharacterized protein EI97DRAFT_431616 [Westerdykella ornata]KAF2278389.1 hypothetical protein EI97DRAFT_431616 [Westerdykella ornata]
MDSTEAELETFRQRWREEVTAKTKGKTKKEEAVPKSSQASSNRAQTSKQSIVPEVSRHARPEAVEEIDEVEPHLYPDLGEVRHGRRLDETSSPAAGSSKEPHSALEHYEKAVEKESQGSLGESVNLYRKAFRLDSNVHQTYKNKHFPPSSFTSKPKHQDINPSNASTTVPNPAHHSLHGLSSNLQSLLDSFSTLSIQAEPPPTDLSPPLPCPISTIPDEILSDILLEVALTDIASFARLAQVCKRLAYLVTTEERIWKRIATGNEVGFGAMHYTFACQVDGKPLGDDGKGGFLLGSDEDDAAPVTEELDPGSLTTLLVPSIYPTYRALFRQRPRIRFNGCYISTVNYTRPGASSPTSVSWNSPIHIVTYYRYLRFLRDGTCISLLTTSEPADVVPYLHLEHVHKNHGNLPSAPMKDALLGRWRLSGPTIPGVDGESNGEKEGVLHVETEGATPKYLYKMILALGSAGRGARNNKLMWQGYWSYNRLTDDWAEFMRKNERPFYWSRVKSYA